VILDSTVIIRHLRKRKEETQLIRKLEAKVKLATTLVNVFEVYYGAYKSKDVKRNLASAKGFLSTLDLLGLDETSAEIAGQVLTELESQGLTIEMRDLFIGCIALKNGFTVVTHNKRHFERIPKLYVMTPTELKSTNTQ
jgi:predicted nucleic acid-binding protein